jgi:hypothetical protein
MSRVYVFLYGSAAGVYLYGSVINGGRGVIPKTDTNALGHCRSTLDTWSALSQTGDSLGHF